MAVIIPKYERRIDYNDKLDVTKNGETAVYLLLVMSMCLCASANLHTSRSATVFAVQ